MNYEINNVTPPPPEQGKRGITELMQHLDTNDTTNINKQSIGKNFLDTLCFKYSDIPAGKHIYVKELHSNIVGSLSIPQYVHIHQSNTPVVRAEYIEVQEIDQVSYKPSIW